MLYSRRVSAFNGGHDVPATNKDVDMYHQNEAGTTSIALNTELHTVYSQTQSVSFKNQNNDIFSTLLWFIRMVEGEGGGSL